MRSPRYDEAYWMCHDFLVEASEDARAAFVKRLFEDLEKPRIYTQHSLRNANLDFSVDYSNDLWKLGDGYVYAYITDKGELFYVGCGQSDRVCNVHSRSKNFKAVYALGASAYVLASHLYKINAEELETLCVWIAQMNGCMLENSSKMLSGFELKYFLSRERGTEVKINAETEKKWNYYEDLKLEYDSVVVKFQRLLALCLDEKEFSKTIPDKQEYRPTQKKWFIDGVEKTVDEWCREYNVPRSRVEGRIKKWGFTPLQALTYPPIPNGKWNRDPLGYFKSLGLVV